MKEEKDSNKNRNAEKVQRKQEFQRLKRHHDFLDLSHSLAYLEEQCNVRYGNTKCGGSACDQCMFMHCHEGK